MMKYAHDDDTIVAPITPPGHSGVGVIRISGSRALSILRALCMTAGGFEPRHVRLEKIFDPRNAQLIDRTIVTFYQSPESYTGEDVVEISSHGNPVIMSAICEGAVFLGARIAEPGEFTKRAFLKGKIDLSQAEAVQELISASTMLAANAAQKRLEGALKESVDGMRGRLLEALVHLEAAVDFPEEELEILSEGRIKELLEGARSGVVDLLGTFRVGRVLSEGAKIAIVGRPNVGKSSILNCFLREERAIVSPEPGTTRDFISEALHIKGIPLKVIDTAGIRETAADAVETEGVDRSRKIIEGADLILFIIDGSVELTEADEVTGAALSGKEFILVINKKDLGTQVSDEGFRDREGCSGSATVSAKTREGIDFLEEIIYRTILGEGGPGSVEVLVGNLRQKEMLERARGYLEEAIRGIEGRISPELTSLEVRDAATSLGEIIGEITTEDILEKIFSSFCIGK